MKRLINIISILTIVGSLVFLFSFSTTETTFAEGAEATIDFSGFLKDSLYIIDFDVSEETLDRLTTREQKDQLKDWLLYTIVSSSGLSVDEINQCLFDVPVVRYGYMKHIANFEYGNTRSVYVGDGKIIALIPEYCTKEERSDYLAYISDKHRKDIGEMPKTLYPFEFDINLDEQYASFKRSDDVNVMDLYTERNGYFEKDIKTLADLENFMNKIQDITYVEKNNGYLVLGGRKLNSRDYRGIRVEDIAAIWQAEKKIQLEIDAFYQRWEDKENKLIDKWENVTYENISEKIALEAEMQDDIKNLEYEKAQERISHNLVDGSGFSLDPTYDFVGLLKYFNQIESKLVRELDKGDIPLSAELIESVKEGLEEENILPYLEFQKVLEYAYYSKVLGAYLTDFDEADTLSNNQAETLGGGIVDIIYNLQEAENSTYKFQAARYDGDLQGTEVGMVLFYTDLLAKLWALDFMNSTPNRYIEDFQALTQVPVSTIYEQESRELPNTRLWFGYNDKGFQVMNYDRGIILFSRNATRVYAASSNPLKPSEETEPSADSEKFLGWWNDHYEETAKYEPEYERLNEIMKWSLLISWLNESNNGSLLEFLGFVNVDHTNWFPDWVNKHEQLRYNKWNKIGFKNKGYKESKTEAMSILFSNSFTRFEGEWTLSGGVSLASKNLFKGRQALSKAFPKLSKRSNIIYDATSGLNRFETFNGTVYNVRKLNPSRISLLAKAKDGTKLRSHSTELINSKFERTIINNADNIKFQTKFSDYEIGKLNIQKTGKSLNVKWEMGDIDQGQSLAKRLSTKLDFETSLKGNIDVKSFAKHPDDPYYFVELENGNKWIKIAPEEFPSAEISEGWLSRVSDPKGGVQNLNLQLVEKNVATQEIRREGVRFFEALPDGKKILREGITSAETEARVIKAELEMDLFNGNYQRLAKNIADDPLKFRFQTNQLVKDKITRIDNLTSEGSLRKASNELDVIGDNFAEWPAYTNRRNIVDINQRLNIINKSNNNSSIFTVEDNLTHYTIYDGKGVSVYKGNNFTDISDALNVRFGAKNRTIYLDMKDFANRQKIDAFESSLRIQQNKLGRDANIKGFARQKGSTANQDIFFTRGIEVTNKPSIELVTNGSFKGSHKITLENFKRVKGKMYDFTINIYTKSKKIANEFLNRFLAQYDRLKMTSGGVRSKSPSDIINEIRIELQNKYKLTEDELIIEFQNQLGGSQIVFITTTDVKFLAA